jgi:predicted porin
MHLMKNKIALTALTALATLTAGSAFAQGSTEIYGRINLSAERQKLNGQTDTGIYDNSSRIGLRGTEDLGGGLKAGFVIEHGFSADTGSAAGTFWGRESTVSLSGSLGTLRLGNMPASEAYFATADYVSMHNHDTGSSSDALYGFVAVGALQNTIAYTRGWCCACSAAAARAPRGCRWWWWRCRRGRAAAAPRAGRRRGSAGGWRRRGAACAATAAR